jgi:tetratricopeptide (TPR) repeat protein
VQAIQRRLQGYGMDLWLDTQKLVVGAEWLTELEAGILRSRAAVIFKGPYNDMDNLKEMDRYGRGYIEARHWPEALYIYHRLAKVAISQSKRGYADSYLQIGRIHFLAGERDKAEKRWEVSLRIYRDYFPEELARCELSRSRLLVSIKVEFHCP